MSDERLRELERRFKETGSTEDEVVWLAERVRARDSLDWPSYSKLARWDAGLAAAYLERALEDGTASMPGIELAALLGEPGACHVLQHPVPKSIEALHALAEIDPPMVLRFMLRVIAAYELGASGRAQEISWLARKRRPGLVNKLLRAAEHVATCPEDEGAFARFHAAWKRVVNTPPEVPWVQCLEVAVEDYCLGEGIDSALSCEFYGWASSALEETAVRDTLLSCACPETLGFSKAGSP